MCNKDGFNQDDFGYCKTQFEYFLKIQYSQIKDIEEQIVEFCHNFCFDDLYDFEKNKCIEYSYGSNSKDVWDCDDTHLARVILFLIHSERDNNEYSIPNLNNFIDIGSGYRYKYRGDTLNTYSTLFGSKNQGLKYFNNEEDIKKIEKFRSKYVTIGNFMLLPALSIKLDSEIRKWDSINTFRGTNEHYKDFFDLFLYKFLDKHDDFKPWREYDGDEKTIIKDYFEVMDNKDEFIKRNILECYFDDKNKFIHSDTENPYCWWIENTDKSQYRNFAIDYITKATNIINYRADKICEILKKIYKN